MVFNKNSKGIFLRVSSFQALAMFRRGLFYSYLAIYLRFFLGLNVTETTLFATIPMVLNVVFQTFVWGRLSDRYQLRRTLIVCGEVLAGIGTLLVWYAHTLADSLYAAGYVIIIGLSIIEIFWSMSNIGWSALISDLYPQEDRNTIQGRLAGIGGIGRLVGVWIGGVLYDGLQLRYEGWGFHEGALFFVAAGAMFISIVPMLFVPEGGIKNEAEAPTLSTVRSADTSGRIFMVFLLAMVFINFGRNSVAVIQTQYLVLDSGFAVSSKGLSYIVNTQSVAMIIAGMISGRIGMWIGNGKALWLGSAVAVISLLMFACTKDLRIIYLASFLKGGSEVIILAASYAFASILIPPEKRARHFGWFNATFFLSWGLAGTSIVGPVIDVLIAGGSSPVFAYQAGFMSAMLLTAIGLVILGILVSILVPRSTIGREAWERP